MIKNRIKKGVALILCVALFSSMTVFANDKPTTKTEVNEDLYATNAQENITIDGISYTYNYYYNEDGLPAIQITNDENQQIDVIEYDKNANTIYLNDTSVATTNEIDNSQNISQDSRASRWSYIGSKSKKIKWKSHVSVAALAAMVSAAIGGVGAAAVIARIGTAGLSVLAGTSGNATVKTKIYRLKAGKVTNYKYVWSVTTSKKKYGNYTTYITT